MVRLRVLMIAALVALGSAGCAPPRPTPPAVVNPPEPRHVTLLKQVHRAPRYTRALLEADPLRARLCACTIFATARSSAYGASMTQVRMRGPCRPDLDALRT